MCGILLSLVSPIMMQLTLVLKLVDSFDTMFTNYQFYAEICFLLPTTCTYYFSELKGKK